MPRRLKHPDKPAEIYENRLLRALANAKLSSSFTADLGADSLEAVELVMELEEEYDIRIPETEAEQIKTIEDAIRAILRHRKGEAA